MWRYLVFDDIVAFVVNVTAFLNTFVLIGMAGAASQCLILNQDSNWYLDLMFCANRGSLTSIPTYADLVACFAITSGSEVPTFDPTLASYILDESHACTQCFIQLVIEAYVARILDESKATYLLCHADLY